jgi:hypothetical protein
MQKLLPLLFFFMLSSRLFGLSMEFQARQGSLYGLARVAQRDMWHAVEWNVVWHRIGLEERSVSWRRPDHAEGLSHDQVNRLLYLLCLPSIRALSERIKDQNATMDGVHTAKIIRDGGAVETVYLDRTEAVVIDEIELILKFGTVFNRTDK